MGISVKTFVLGDLSTNTYVITEGETNECAVVDPSAEDERLTAFLKTKNVRYILITHGHFDHIMGVDSVKNLVGGKVVVHRADEPALTDSHLNLIGLQYSGESINLKADIVVEDGDELPFGNTKFKVMHTPGHTKGGVCYILEKERIIFSGDTLFKLSAGRTDFPGGNPREELMSLSRLAKLSGDYTVYTGHGESTTLQYEKDNNRYVRVRD